MPKDLSPQYSRILACLKNARMKDAFLSAYETKKNYTARSKLSNFITNLLTLLSAAQGPSKSAEIIIGASCRQFNNAFEEMTGTNDSFGSSQQFGGENWYSIRSHFRPMYDDIKTILEEYKQRQQAAKSARSNP